MPGVPLHSEDAARKLRGVSAIREIMVTHVLSCCGRNTEEAPRTCDRKGGVDEDSKGNEGFTENMSNRILGGYVGADKKRIILVR